MTATISQPPTITADDDIENRRLDLRMQSICVWCGPVFVLLYMTFFAGVAGWVPPRPPSWDAQTLAAWYADHRMSIRIGQTGAVIALGVLMPFWMVIGGYIRDIERGRMKILYMLWITVQAVNMVLFTIPSLCWVLATYREDLPPQVLQTLHDMGWLMFLSPFAQYLTATLVMGIAALTDRRSMPVWPRWVGWFCLAEVATTGLGGFVIFFKGGPLAWNGLLGFYVVNLCWFLWITVTVVTMHKYIKRQRALLDAPAQVAAQ